jgi:hypothetical protein
MMKSTLMTLSSEVLLEASLSYLTGNCNSSDIYPREEYTTRIMKMLKGISGESRRTRNGRRESRSDPSLIFRLSNVGLSC